MDLERRDERGIACPQCGCRHLFVVYTRPRPDRIVRRKECRNYGRRIVNVERVSGDARHS